MVVSVPLTGLEKYEIKMTILNRLFMIMVVTIKERNEVR